MINQSFLFLKNFNLKKIKIKIKWNLRNIKYKRISKQAS
jgi:hypothetical protein